MKKPASSVPSLPVVNGNSNNTSVNGFIRPLSSNESNGSHKIMLNSNSSSKINEYRTPNNTAGQNDPNRKNKNYLSEKVCLNKFYFFYLCCHTCCNKIIKFNF